MSNNNQLYEQLALKKEELTQKLQDIIEISEGKDNPKVAKKITELETEKLETDKQIETLKKQKEILENQSVKLQEDINKLSGHGVQRILDAIKKQRWFYFKDKPKVIFDKATAFLWQNIEYWKFREETFANAKPLKNYKLEGFIGWNLPEAKDVRLVAEYIKQKDINKIWINDKNTHSSYACYFYLSSNRIDYTSSSDNLSYIYCSKVLSPTQNPDDFYNNTKADNKIYSDDEKAKMVLDIFANNKFKVIFDEEGITDLYNKLFFDKDELIKQIQEIEDQIADLPKPSETIVDFIDFKELIRGFDLEIINNSKLQYCMSLLKWFNLLISKLDDFKRQYQELLVSADNYEKRILDSCTEGDHQLIHQRTKYLSEHLNFGMETLNSDLLSFKEEAVSLIYELNNAKNLQAVYKFNKKELPDFYLIAEQTSAMFSAQLLKVEMFKNNQETFNQIADIHEKWRNNLREFLNVTKSHFNKHCKKNKIEEELFTKWYNEWSEIRLSIERHIEPLIKAGIEKVLPFKEIIRISDLTSKFLTDEYDLLYSKQLIPIYQKYAFDKKTGEIHLTLEKESFIQNILSKFRSEIEDVIFDVDTNEGRLFIVRWAQDWYEEQIDNIVTFTANKDISDKIAKDTLKDLHELKQRNFETVLLDKKAYAEANKELTDAFNALMFKMRTEADKK